MCRICLTTARQDQADQLNRSMWKFFATKQAFLRSRYSVLVQDNSTITITAATTITADTAVDSASVSFASFSSARGRESLTYDAALPCREILSSIMWGRRDVICHMSMKLIDLISCRYIRIGWWIGGRPIYVVCCLLCSASCFAMLQVIQSIHS